MNDPKIVVIGGGTGTYTALTGLKKHSKNITAVVTMADDGGSSGRLRDEFGHLPPGDARRCLVALAADDRMNRMLRALFEYRFDKGYGLNGHSFGNLMLTALTELTGSAESAILEASRLLNIRGRVLPVTTDNVRLCATLEDGTVIRGETNIDERKIKHHLKIRGVYLAPEAKAYQPALDAIREADILVIGPGDLYTSVIPNLLAVGVPDAIRDCQGARIYVSNMMTKAGETDGFSASSFVSEIRSYLKCDDALDGMIVNNGEFPSSRLTEYAAENAYPVEVDAEKCLEFVPQVFQSNLLAEGSLVRHDSDKLADFIIEVGSAIHAQKIQIPNEPASSSERVKV